MHALRNMNETDNPFIYPEDGRQDVQEAELPDGAADLREVAGGGTGDWKAFGKVLNSGH